jgi:apolipoprotein N-acyltransferase
MRTLPRMEPFVLGTLFALLYALGMPGYNVPGLPFVCLVPLLQLVVRAQDSGRGAVHRFVAGTTANLLLYYWIAYTVAVPGQLGWITGAAAAFLVSAYLAVYIGAAGWFAHRLDRWLGEAGLLAFPAVWTALELARSVLFKGFPWMLLGYGLSGSLVMRQAADLAGVLGLGFLLALANVFAYRAVRRAAERTYGRAIREAALLAAVPAFLAAYGHLQSQRPHADAFPVLRIGLAQGGIDQSLKWNPDHQRETLAIYRTLTQEARELGAQIVVWPETAAPFFYGWEGPLSREVESIAASADVPLVFGAPWFDPAEGGKYFNSVFLLSGRGVAKGRYDKRHLVPFGEYMPLRRVFFFMKKLTVGEDDFTAGTGPVVLRVAGRPAGISVCYEAVFPGILRESIRSGAELFVNVTNDAWFGDTVAPHQHLAMARMRSVEFRRPMVRAANAGISAFVDARGEITATLGLFRQGAIAAPVRPNGSITLYAKTGETFAVACTIMTALISLMFLRGHHGVRTVRR